VCWRSTSTRTSVPSSGATPSTGLRNRLAHVYEDVDPVLVYEALHQALDLYPQFVEAIEAYLGRA
jgi:uncharacterized protein YutE (UPF0331/DUF86 family)